MKVFRMKVFRTVLFAGATVVFFSLAASAQQHDYGNDPSPNGARGVIKTGTPCEMGTLLPVGELDGNHFLVKAYGLSKSGKMEEVNYPGGTNFDCGDGRGEQMTQPGKVLQFGEILIAPWDKTTCDFDRTLLQIWKCAKTFPGKNKQVFTPDFTKPQPPLVIATEYDTRTPVCERQQAPPPQPVTVRPVEQQVVLPSLKCEVPKAHTLAVQFDGMQAAIFTGETTSADSYRFVAKNNSTGEIVWESNWRTPDQSSRRASVRVNSSQFNRKDGYSYRIEVKNSCGHDEDGWEGFTFDLGSCSFGGNNPMAAAGRWICREKTPLIITAITLAVGYEMSHRGTTHTSTPNNKPALASPGHAPVYGAPPVCPSPTTPTTPSPGLPSPGH